MVVDVAGSRPLHGSMLSCRCLFAYLCYIMKISLLFKRSNTSCFDLPIHFADLLLQRVAEQRSKHDPFGVC